MVVLIYMFLDQAVHLDLVNDMTTTTFIRCFSAHRGVPSMMISDNAKPFKAASKILRQLLATPEARRNFHTLVSHGNLTMKRLFGGVACSSEGLNQLRGT